jgi:hypothetical protein
MDAVRNIVREWAGGGLVDAAALRRIAQLLDLPAPVEHDNTEPYQKPLG